MKRVFNPLTEQFDMVGDNDSSILIFDNYITDQTPCDLLTLSELKGRLTDESTIVFLSNAQINNSVIVKSTFAIKDYKGLYATVAQPGDTILKDFIPIPNKIFLCKADGLLYFYDGKTLCLFSTHSGLITTENFNNINEKIALNCAILPFSKVDEKTPDIDSANKPDNPTGVILIPLKKCLAAFDGSKYYSNWDEFTYNNIYYPSSKEYNKESTLLRDISEANKLGSRFLMLNKYSTGDITNITTDITEKLFVVPLQPVFTLVSGYNYFCNADLRNITHYTIRFNTQTNISTPIRTSRVIIVGSKINGINFNIPSADGFTTIWENGEPPVVEIGKYYIFEFTEMFNLFVNKRTLFITYKSISPNKVENPNPEYVDLGLPSGTLWATKNVGATSPEDYGDYYAWGETATKEEYTQENSLVRGLTPSELQTQGIIDDNNNLTSQYDAATAQWGEEWRMPTRSEMNELLNNCIVEFIVLNRIKGARFTGPNGNSIFLPAAGIYFPSGHQYLDVGGIYFSSSLFTVDNDIAATLDFTVSDVSIGVAQQGVHQGLSIRPVRNI